MDSCTKTYREPIAIAIAIVIVIGTETAKFLIPSEMGMALFMGMKIKSTSARHSVFFFPMGIGKKKTGIHRSKEGACIMLWIPVFFGQDRTIKRVFYADTVPYQQ